MSTMSTMSRGVWTFPRNTHSAAHCNAIVYVCNLQFGCIETKKCPQKIRYWLFWTSTHSTQPGRGNLFDILRNQAFSLRQRVFSGKILRRRKSSVGQFWSRVWTGEHSSGVDKMTQMCLSAPIRVRCGPFGSRY